MSNCKKLGPSRNFWLLSKQDDSSLAPTLMMHRMNSKAIEPESLICACGALHWRGVSGRFDVVPAQFRVIATRRPKNACRACTDGVVQAPAPARLIQAGRPTEATVAHVLISKYAVTFRFTASPRS